MSRFSCRIAWYEPSSAWKTPVFLLYLQPALLACCVEGGHQCKLPVHRSSISPVKTTSPSLTYSWVGFQIKSKNMGGKSRSAYVCMQPDVCMWEISVGIVQRSQCTLYSIRKLSTMIHLPGGREGGFGAQWAFLITFFHGYLVLAWKMNHHSHEGPEVNCNLFLGSS